MKKKQPDYIGLYVDKVSGRTLYKRSDHYSKYHKTTAISYFKDPELVTLHREDGPAIFVEGDHELWLYNNIIHRMNGPAYSGDFRNNRYNQMNWVIDNVLIFSIETGGKVVRRLKV
jgi:hypothetical protein